MHMRSAAHPRSPAIGALAPGHAYRRHSVSPNVNTATSAHAHAHGPLSSTSTTNREGSIGSASPALDANGLTQVTKRKKKKPGWKGYAMQYLDDDGEVLEERLRDETPPREGEVQVTAANVVPATAPASNAQTAVPVTATTTSASASVATPSTAPPATRVKSRSPGKR